MRAARLLLGAVGVVLVLVGGWRLAGAGLSDLVDIAGFLAAGVIGHDAVLAPLVVVVALAVVRLPSWARPQAVVGLVVLTSVTLMALPVLGRFGARPDVPSLLNRSYGVLWLGFAAVVVVLVVVAALARRRTSRAG
jgi:hypothetical protein